MSPMAPCVHLLTVPHVRSMSLDSCSCKFPLSGSLPSLPHPSNSYSSFNTQRHCPLLQEVFFKPPGRAQLPVLGSSSSNSSSLQPSPDPMGLEESVFAFAPQTGGILRTEVS